MRHEQAISQLIGQAARLYARALDCKLGRLGVSSGQASVLVALAEGGALSQKALIEIVGVAQPTMAATLSRMKRDGLIKRRIDPADRRSRLFALTPEAMKEAPSFIQAISEVNEAALIYFDDKECTALLGLLRQVVDALETSLRAAE